MEAEAPAAAPVADADQRLWDELDECGIAHFRERARSTELVRCAQRGIPPARRAAVWHACAGSAELRARFAHDVYSRLLHQPCAELKPIERDIRRTFPELLALSKGASERLVRSLGHVLKAYAVYDPGTGYCQVAHARLHQRACALDARRPSPQAAITLLRARTRGERVPAFALPLPRRA